MTCLHLRGAAQEGDIWGQVFFGGHLPLWEVRMPTWDVVVTAHCLVFTMSFPATETCRADMVMTMAVLVGVAEPRSGSCPRILHVSSHPAEEGPGCEPGAFPGNLTLL